MSALQLEGLRQRLRTRPRNMLAVSRSEPACRRAAVLVPLLGPQKDPKLLFFERSRHVLEHVGEICFPGGSIEPEDRDAVEAALRESGEELGLSRGSIEIVGLLDDVETVVSNYAITPVVGYIDSIPKLVPDEREVSRVIVAQLSRFLDPGVEEASWAEYQGVTKLRYTYTLDGDRIWGATARILHNFLEITYRTP